MIISVPIQAIPAIPERFVYLKPDPTIHSTKWFDMDIREDHAANLQQVCLDFFFHPNPNSRAKEALFVASFIVHEELWHNKKSDIIEDFISYINRRSRAGEMIPATPIRKA